MKDEPRPAGTGDVVLAPGAPDVEIRQGRYSLHFARGPRDLDAILRLRFQVFNLELGEGLETSHETGRDQDPFDAACHHLIVEDREALRAIGTYRMQTREMAETGRGFYSAGEFELSSLPDDVLSAAVEVGRACIAEEYRSRQVLFLLWKGLAAYLSHFHKRFLFGCCSLTGVDARLGRGALRHLEESGHLHPRLRVDPLPGLECVADGEPAPFVAADVPRLFRTYLRYGAKACGPPALDRQFNTTDFLVLLDVEALDRDLFRMFFR